MRRIDIISLNQQRKSEPERLGAVAAAVDREVSRAREANRVGYELRASGAGTGASRKADCCFRQIECASEDLGGAAFELERGAGRHASIAEDHDAGGIAGCRSRQIDGGTSTDGRVRIVVARTGRKYQRDACAGHRSTAVHLEVSLIQVVDARTLRDVSTCIEIDSTAVDARAYGHRGFCGVIVLIAAGEGPG